MSTGNEAADQLKAKVEAVADHYDADIFGYVGILIEPIDNRVIKIVRKRQSKRKNILLILSTPGGSADAAYRIARCFQRCYGTNAPGLKDGGEFIVYVHDMCASAGTLLALGATRLIMSQKSQLGPIDVQLRKEDEVGERRSGLTSRQALETLATEAGRSFSRLFRYMRFEDSIQLPTKMASEIAATMSVSMMEPIYAQIDPMRLGETERYVKISQEYGQRLRTANVKGHAIEKLASGYPSHEFVIDREEAEGLFNFVQKPTDDLEHIAEHFIRNNFPNEERPGFNNYLSDEMVSTKEGADDVQTADPTLREGAKGTGQDDGQIRSPAEGGDGLPDQKGESSNGVLGKDARGGGRERSRSRGGTDLQ